MKLNIDCVNWPAQFPEKPVVSVDVTNDREALYLKYSVKGEQLRAVTAHDQGPVWEDSCVEFFCQVPGEPYYYNFETNCIGAMVASRRRGREEDVLPFSPDEMEQIERKCTYPRKRKTDSSNGRSNCVFRSPLSSETRSLTSRKNCA